MKAFIRENFSRAIRKALPGFRPGISIEITLHGPKPAASVDLSISAFGAKASDSVWVREDMVYLSTPYDVRADGDLRIDRTITDETISAVADILRADHYRGARHNGRPLDPYDAKYGEMSAEDREQLRTECEAEIDEREAEKG